MASPATPKGGDIHACPARTHWAPYCCCCCCCVSWACPVSKCGESPLVVAQWPVVTLWVTPQGQQLEGQKGPGQSTTSHCLLSHITHTCVALASGAYTTPHHMPCGRVCNACPHHPIKPPCVTLAAPQNPLCQGSAPPSAPVAEQASYIVSVSHMCHCQLSAPGRSKSVKG